MASVFKALSRSPIYILMALVANLLIFYFIMQLVANDRFDLPELEDLNLVDFIRFDDELTPIDEIVEKKELEQPPPPEEVPQPPEIPQPEISKPEISPLDLALPNLEVPLTVEGTPFVGDVLRSAPVKGDAVSTKGSAQGISSNNILTNIKPAFKKPIKYPRRAERAGIEGYVTVEFILTKEGTVKNPVIVKSVPPKVFDKAVLRVINEWRYQPHIVNGRPVEIRTRQKIPFKMERR